MELHGITYLGFLAFLVLLARLPLRSVLARQGTLLLASYGFYGTWNLEFLSMLIGASLFNYWWCGLIRRSESGRLLGAGVALNAAGLIVFKSGWTTIELVGISFFTFQAISAQIDTWRGFRERPTLVEFSLFMAFWPTILAGPICRLPEMLPQYRTLSPVNREGLVDGARRILVGLFQKLVVAETLFRGIGPDGGIGAFSEQSAAALGLLDAWTLAVGTGLYIYFDFCGYSNIAIGSGRLFGLQLRENFDRPFLATSPADFWSRWHMSLSSWIRDYVFFPLAALGRARLWSYGVLVLSMVLFGLWHGLQGHFFWWGVYQGLVLAGHRVVARDWSRMPPLVGGVLTFLLIAVGWPLFADTGGLLPLVGLPDAQPGVAGSVGASLPGLVIVTLAAYLIYEWARSRLNGLGPGSRWPARLRLVAPLYYATMALWIVVWSEQASPFVYVRF